MSDINFHELACMKSKGLICEIKEGKYPKISDDENPQSKFNLLFSLLSSQERRENTQIYIVLTVK